MFPTSPPPPPYINPYPFSHKPPSPLQSLSSSKWAFSKASPFPPSFSPPSSSPPPMQPFSISKTIAPTQFGQQLCLVGVGASTGDSPGAWLWTLAQLEPVFRPGPAAASMGLGVGGARPGTAVASSNAQPMVHPPTPWLNSHLTSSTTWTSLIYPWSMGLMCLWPLTLPPMGAPVGYGARPTSWQCPSQLRAQGGCNNPCTVFKTDQYCCNSGSCGPTDYSRYFKTRCPDAYSYPKDDQTSTFTCPGGTNYEVIFCP